MCLVFICMPGETYVGDSGLFLFCFVGVTSLEH